jgi:Matrixin
MIVGALALALSGCWFPNALNQSGSAMTWSCGPITYSIEGDASFAATVRAATAEVSQLSGRPLVERAGGVLTIKLEWPTGSPSASGWTGIRNDGSHYTGGTVYINPAAGAPNSAYRTAVIRHELGHVLGMAHTNDLNSIMYFGYMPVLDYTDVDIAGLRSLGSAC